MHSKISSDRSKNYIVQIKGAIIYRAVAVCASFLSLPLMINYLGNESFGIWSTILAIISWTIFFDLGIANGLRNKIAESISKGDSFSAQGYIGAAYILIGALSLTIWAIFFFATYEVSWEKVFNTRGVSEGALRTSIQISGSFLILNFWLGLITAQLNAIQRTSIVALGQLATQMLSLAFILILEKYTTPSLEKIALAYAIATSLPNMFLTYWHYKNNPHLRPTLKGDKEYFRPLLSTGLGFFVIQVAVLAIFTTDKIIITQIFGPAHVTEYEVILKIFSTVGFLHAIITNPLWSAYTDAYYRGDIQWIRRMLKKQLYIYCGILIGTAILALATKPLIFFWIGPNFNASSELIIAISLCAIISAWNNIFATVLNGINAIGVQLYTATTAIIINIPMSIMLSKYTSLGISGVVYGTVCSLLIASFILPFQVYRALQNTTMREPLRSPK